MVDAQLGVVTAWGRFDVDLDRNPKVAGLSDAAFRAYVRVILWSVEQLTDGHIADTVPLSQFVSGRTPRKTWLELVERGLLDEEPDGWTIHDFTEKQLPSGSVKRKREQTAERQRRHRRVEEGSNVTPLVTRDRQRDGSVTRPPRGA